MKYEIFNGDYVGTAEWQGPGRVALDMDDDETRMWFEHYFTKEDAYLIGDVGFADGSSMTAERRDSSEEAFERAAWSLAAYAYEVKRGDGRRDHRYRARRVS